MFPMTRRTLIHTSLASFAMAQAPSGAKHYVRSRRGSATSYGILEGDSITEMRGDLFSGKPGSTKHKLADVKLLTPCVPPKVLAVGLNYKSHIGARPAPKAPECSTSPSPA